jgi:hypothetical protein
MRLRKEIVAMGRVKERQEIGGGTNADLGGGVSESVGEVGARVV